MKKTVLVLFLFLFSGHGFSQYSRFRHLQVDDGLSENSVQAFVQDSLGFIWIGTGSGLDRYDGLTFKNWKYDPADSNSLSSSSIKALIARKNILWIGTYGGGLDRLDLATGEIKRYVHDPADKKSICGDNIFCLKEIGGIFYIGTADGGATTFDPDQELFTPVTVIPSVPVRDICADKTGNIWFATTGAGLIMLDPHTQKTRSYRADGTKQGLLSDRVRAVYADSRGWIWVSCWSAGCNVIEPSTGNVYNNRLPENVFGRDVSYGLVSAFLEDPQKNIWLCTAENGAVRYDPETGEKKIFMNDANDLYSISDNTVFTIYEDRSHIMWLGTWRGGVNIFDPKTDRFGWFRKDAKDSTSLSNNTVYAMEIARDNTVWMGTANGVCSFDPKTKNFRALRTNGSSNEMMPNNSTVYDVKEQRDSSLWFATSGGGLYHYFPKTNKFIHYNNNALASRYIASSSPSVLIFDENDHFYVGTYGMGLLVYNNTTDNFSVFSHDSANVNSISGDLVGSLALAANGKLWVGTADGGLNLFDPVTKKFQRFLNDPKDPNTILENGVSNMCVDHHGKLWIGTSSGLCRYDPDSKHFTPYSQMHAFLKQEIVSITEDRSGCLWIATRKGLARLNATDNTLRTFAVSDGLQSNAFLFKATANCPDGSIYLGGFNGFNHFIPSEIRDNTSLPFAVITDFTVLNKKYALYQDVSFTKEITLSYLDYFFSFRFSALEFTDPKKNAFKYKLEGFNTDWVEIGNNNSVTFTNLDPGEYVLKLKAANSSGVWNENATELKIIITPPFWRTKWFYALCIAATILSAYSFIKWREKKLVEEKMVLENKVEKRTEELRHEKEKVEAAHKDIRDSINYAKKIQTAILPQDAQFSSLLPQSFVLFKPKDIVSGDFYWISENKGDVFYVTADCTGHGVPGGFMTMLGTSLLNEIVNEKNVTEPARVLDILREKIIASLKQSSTAGESKDGMDMVLVKLNKEKNMLTYAAANNSLYLVRDGVLTEYKPDKQPIGFYEEQQKAFSQHEIILKKGDLIYTFTDGYADQFGGDKGKKFKYKQLEQLLLSVHSHSMHEQKKILDDTIESWKEGYEQLDDILGIGIKI